MSKGQGRPKKMPKPSSKGKPMNQMPAFPGSDGVLNNAPGYKKGGYVTKKKSKKEK